MKVSVIIVNHNGVKYLPACLDSVLADKDPNLEVIVVENNSTDDSWAILRRKYGRNRRVKLLRSKTNLFFAGGCNFGANTAGGEWLIFLNPDTVVAKDWLRALRREAKKSPRRLLQPKILMARRSKRIDNAGGCYLWPGYGLGVGRGEKDLGQYAETCQTDFAQGTCLMIARKFFEELQGFEESFRYFYEDVDLNLRAKARGGQAFVVGESVIWHWGGASFRQNPGSEEVVYYVRRNRLLTVIKNYQGLAKWSRVGGILISYLGLPRKKVSWRALIGVVGWEVREFVNWIRIGEVEKRMDGKDRWLDLGCGEGALGRQARTRGWEVAEIDESRGTRIEDWQGRKKYQVVSLYHVLEHVEDPELVLKRVRRWLMPAGILVIEVPVVGGATARFLGEDYLIYQDKTHRHFWNVKEWRRCLRNAGYREIGVGATWMAFPFHLVTASWRKSVGKGIVSMILWLPYKILNILGDNPEIVRLYVVKQS